MAEEEEEMFAKIWNLCESDPDEGLEFIKKAISEKPVLESYAFLKSCKARAYQIKGVQPLRDKPWVKVGIAGPEELRLYINDENLNYLELALSEISQVEDLDPEVVGSLYWAEGDTQVDTMACILERCRPGRVQQILGKTKLLYFNVGRIKTVPSEEELPPEKRRPFLDIPFSFPSIIKSVLVLEVGRDAKGREYIHYMLFGKLFDDFEPGETCGDAEIGTIYLFNDGTFAHTLEKEHKSEESKEPHGKKEEPKKKGFFRKLFD
jgi:hypothetical protein